MPFQVGVGEKGVCTRKSGENCDGEYMILCVCQRTINLSVKLTAHEFLKIKSIIHNVCGREEKDGMKTETNVSNCITNKSHNNIKINEKKKIIK